MNAKKGQVCSQACKLYTEGSHSSEPFFTQVNHLISSNRFSKQVMNPADFPTLKIWDQSDHWLKSYGQNLFWSQINFLAITFEPVVRLIPNFEGAKICMVDGLFSNAVQPLSQ